MRRTLLLAAALVAAFALVVGPALSVRPYQPRAVDFELAAPALSAAGSGPVSSGVVRTPKRFNIVGLRWRGDAEPRISLRVRDAGGSWSRWVRVDGGPEHAPDRGSDEAVAGASASDPVWAGEAEAVQYRLSRRVPGLRLHFVNTTGSATAADRARTALRRAANAGLRRVAALVGGTAGAQDPQPEIAPRAAWENGECTPRGAPAYREVKVGFVHHTVNANEYSAEEVPALIRGMCRYHRNSQGWNDLGYNFVVDRFGRIWEGRAGGVDKPVVGAHTAGMNTQSFGVSNLGTYSDVPVTEEAMQAMTRLIRWKLPLHGQPTTGQVTVVSNGGGGSHFEPGEEATLERVSGHRDANSTSCPGQALYDQLPQLRERVAGAPVAPRAAPSVSVVRPIKHVKKGTNLKIRGGIDPPKQSLSVLMEKKTRGTWQRFYGRTVALRADGTFVKKIRFRYEGLYRVSAVFGGDGSHGPAQSKRYSVRVPRRGGSSGGGSGQPPYSEPGGGAAAAR